MEMKYDLIVIGGGPGGYEAAVHAAKCGMKTALIEKGELGGTCLNRGCIPTKTLLHTAEIYRGAGEFGLFGLSASDFRFDMDRMRSRKEEVIAKLQDGIAFLLKNSGVELIKGEARIVSEGLVEVRPSDTDDSGARIFGTDNTEPGEDNNVKQLNTNKILAVTGSAPGRIPVPGAELPGVITSDELLAAPAFYGSLVIVGGGVVGMEMAVLYSSLGSRVTVLEAEKRILPQMDREISQSLSMILKKRGVGIHTGAVLQEFSDKPEGGLICRFEEKDKSFTVEGDKALISVGRKPYGRGLFTEEMLQKYGEKLLSPKGEILVNDGFETCVPGLYAAGDVIGGIQLAHAATAEGIAAVDWMAGRKPTVRLDVIPSCIYSNPEIAVCGLSADEAKEKGISARTYKFSMLANGKSLIENQDRGFVKIVTEEESGVIIGAQLMCARATDMIAQLTQAVVNRLTKDQIACVVHPHPTFSEGIWEAVR